MAVYCPNCGPPDMVMSDPMSGVKFCPICGWESEAR